MTAKTARPAAAKKPAKTTPPVAPAATAPKRFTPELIAKAAKLRESGMTWDKIGEQLDVRSTGLLSKRVREAASQPATPNAKPARKAAAPKATPTPSPRPRKAAKAPSAAPAGEQS